MHREAATAVRPDEWRRGGDAVLTKGEGKGQKWVGQFDDRSDRG